ncbi:hypothetical protein SK128_023065 [Halocaridina rubra]|uniref:Uncharacterized protein n=1 Tax=Halocaridina rubra TaxID=373956 RepID=A0AAN8ZYM8_HALRR
MPITSEAKNCFILLHATSILVSFSIVFIYCYKKSGAEIAEWLERFDLGAYSGALIRNKETYMS